MEKKSVFEKAVKLSARVAIYVPGTCGVDTAADTSAVADHVAAQLSAMFGGATKQKAAGCWLSEAAGPVSEDVTVVYAFADPADLEQYREAIGALALDIKRDLRQEAVSVELDGALYLI